MTTLHAVLLKEYARARPLSRFLREKKQSFTFHFLSRKRQNTEKMTKKHPFYGAFLK